MAVFFTTLQMCTNTRSVNKVYCQFVEQLQLSYPRWVQQSSSPHRRHRRQTASQCSSARSVKYTHTHTQMDLSWEEKLADTTVVIWLWMFHLQHDHTYEWWDVRGGGHNRKHRSNVEIMEWDVCVLKHGSDARQRRFTGHNQTQHRQMKRRQSIWDGRHGLLMVTELAIKNVSDCSVLTLFPSKGSSFIS